MSSIVPRRPRGFASIVLRHARRSAEAIETSAQTIEAYAHTLEASEARFRDVAEASSDWIWETDPELRLTYISGRFSEVTDSTADEAHAVWARAADTHAGVVTIVPGATPLMPPLSGIAS